MLDSNLIFECAVWWMGSSGAGGAGDSLGDWRKGGNVQLEDWRIVRQLDDWRTGGLEDCETVGVLEDWRGLWDWPITGELEGCKMIGRLEDCRRTGGQDWRTGGLDHWRIVR